MFEQFYGLNGPPFQLTPDQRFFYGSSQHSRAIAHLTFGLSQAEGFIVVTGEVGAGKTTLIERLLTQLDRRAYVVTRINTTQLSADDLFRLTMAGFGIEPEGQSKAAMLLRFEDVLRDQRAAGRRCLLVVDEAQNLPIPAIEELRMLSNITEGGRASLQTILLGQPQFRKILASPDLDQLRQRVLASYHLGPITSDETRDYIRHRLATAGWVDRPHWQDDAFVAVYTATGGIPRRINRLCARVLLLGALESTNEITAEMVRTTASELDDDLEAGAPPPGAILPAGAAAPSAAGGNGALRGAASLLNGHDADLAPRIAALEERASRQERMLQRIISLASGDQP